MNKKEINQDASSQKIETKLKILQDKFEALCDEQEGLYRKDFEKVFERLFELDNTLTKNFPCTANITNINKALKMAGFEKDKNFCNGFKRYNEIFITGKEIQGQILKELPKPQGINLTMITGCNIDSLQIQGTITHTNDEWRFYPINIIAPQPLMTIIDVSLEKDAKAGKGLFNNVTDIPEEDENLDEWFDIDAYGLKCSLEPLYRDLQNYGILDSILKSETIKKYFLQTLKNTLIGFIKSNTDKPNKVRNHITKTLKELDDIPAWGLLLQILLLQGLVKWFEGVNLNEGDNGYDEACTLVQWIGKQLMEKEVRFCYFFWGKDDKEFLKPFCNYLYSTDIGKEIQAGLIRSLAKNDEKETKELQQEEPQAQSQDLQETKDGINKEDDNQESIDYNANTITQIYNYCNDGIFNVAHVTFINAINNADFGDIYRDKSTIKTKCAYLIYVLSGHIASKDWYKKTANSIGFEPSKCSGRCADSEWKKHINRIK